MVVVVVVVVVVVDVVGRGGVVRVTCSMKR